MKGGKVTRSCITEGLRVQAIKDAMVAPRWEGSSVLHIQNIDRRWGRHDRPLWKLKRCELVEVLGASVGIEELQGAVNSKVLKEAWMKQADIIWLINRHL